MDLTGNLKMKIFKYEIPIKDKFDLELPVYSKILSFQVQNGKPYIWVLLDDKQVLPLLRHRYFTLVGSGHEFDHHPDVMKYIGTIQLDSFVWHLFEDLI